MDMKGLEVIGPEMTGMEMIGLEGKGMASVSESVDGEIDIPEMAGDLNRVAQPRTVDDAPWLAEHLPKLSKGYYISPMEIENGTGIQRTSSDYSLMLLKYIAAFEKFIAATHGTYIRIVQERWGLKFLCDDEHATRCVDDRKNHINGLKRTAWRQRTIDHSKLTPEQLVEHNRELQKTAFLLKSIESSAKKEVITKLVGE